MQYFSTRWFDFSKGTMNDISTNNLMVFFVLFYFNFAYLFLVFKVGIETQCKVEAFGIFVYMCFFVYLIFIAKEQPATFDAKCDMWSQEIADLQEYLKFIL